MTAPKYVSRDVRKRHAARALASLAVRHPSEVAAVDEYLAELRRECAHWRTRVRELEGRLNG
jgi:hypothetical protein